MDPIWITLGIAIATIISNLVISIVSNKKNIALIEYRLKQLEDRQNQHNNLITRMYQIEKEVAILKDEIKNK